jgi:hypothetical protein
MRRREFALDNQTEQPTPYTMSAAPAPLPPPVSTATHVDIERLTAQMEALEQRLVEHLASLSTQANAARHDAERAKDDARTESSKAVETAEAMVRQVREALEADQNRLRHALDQRLAELSVASEWRTTELESRLVQRLQEEREQVGGQASTFAQKVAEVEGRLAWRIGELEQHIDRVVDGVEQYLTSSFADVRSEIDERIAGTTAALRTAEARLGEELTTQVAHLKTDLDVRLQELSARLTIEVTGLTDRIFTLEQRHLAVEAKNQSLAQRVAEIDVEAIDTMREKVTSLAGETVLVRIEMDRLTEGLEERFDKMNLRLVTMESKLDDDADISLSVQMERLEELERSLLELDPDRFATREELRQLLAGSLPAPSQNPDSTTAPYLRAVAD